MIYLTNPRFLALWKSLRLEVADSGLAQVDTTWNMVNVCSPYSRLYFISHGGGILTLRGREIPLKEGCVYLIPAGLLYNYRCDASMEQLYFHVNITQVNGMDLFYGCDTVYEHDAPAEDLEKVLALYRSQRMEDAFLLQGLLWEELGRFIQMADLQEAQTKNIFWYGGAGFPPGPESGQRRKPCTLPGGQAACIGEHAVQTLPGGNRHVPRCLSGAAGHSEGLPPVDRRG